MSGLVRGDALRLPFADESVDLVITSPPYFALRSYQDDGEHYENQIGSEPTPQDFLEALWAVTAECARVLKPSGSMFVNLGDKYAGSGGHNNSGISGGASQLQGRSQRKVPVTKATRRSAPDRYNQESGGVPAKSLMMLPERYRIGCVDRLGLIARAVVVWCLSGGAKVYARLPTGDRPIMLRDLVRHYQPEQVKLWNGQKWTQVLGWNRSADTDGALELELRSGERIGCTVGHQWPTSRGLLRAGEIRVGDVIDTCRLPEPDSPRSPAFLPDEDIGWLVGLYLAEGSRSGTTVQFAAHVKETERHERLARIAAALDATCNVYQTGENTATCNLHGSTVVGVIDRYVSPGTAKTKRLNLAAWRRGDAFLAAVMEGYLHGDGGYDAKNDRWRLGFTENDEWASDVRTLAARLGASLTLKRSATTAFADGSGDLVFPGWRGEWRWRPSPHRNTRQRSEVVAIRFSRARQFFDVGVADEPHTFALASGVLTHNSKPNGLPESVTDRVRRSHEDWVHLTRRGSYYAAVDEIREAHAGEFLSSGVRNPRFDRPGGQMPGRAAGLPDGKQQELRDQLGQKGNRFTAPLNPLGKLPGSVWTVPTEPLQVPDYMAVSHPKDMRPPFLDERGARAWARHMGLDEAGHPVSPWPRPDGPHVAAAPDHFAAFPTEWPRRLILGWSPPGVCTGCGEGRRPATSVEHAPHWKGGNRGHTTQNGQEGVDRRTVARTNPVHTITGYACDCAEPNAPTRPAIVLDPFCGTGTTVLVARALGRMGVGVDLSADYLRLARWRVEDSGHGQKAERRSWEARQGGLFEGVA